MAETALPDSSCGRNESVSLPSWLSRSAIRSCIWRSSASTSDAWADPEKSSKPAAVIANVVKMDRITVLLEFGSQSIRPGEAHEQSNIRTAPFERMDTQLEVPTTSRCNCTQKSNVHGVGVEKSWGRPGGSWKTQGHTTAGELSPARLSRCRPWVARAFACIEHQPGGVGFRCGSLRPCCEL